MQTTNKESTTVTEKPTEKECWSFFDCELMTGYLPGECPNHEECKKAYTHNCDSLNCEIPYTTGVIINRLPNGENEVCQCVYVYNYLESSAIEAGYHTAVDLFYLYSKEGVLVVGQNHPNNNYAPIPEEAIALGFARAETIPYYLPEYWGGTKSEQFDRRSTALPQEWIDAGFSPAVELPYVYEKCFFLEDEYHFLEERMVVSFDPTDPKYQDAIKVGWYPAEGALYPHGVSPSSWVCPSCGKAFPDGVIDTLMFSSLGCCNRCFDDCDY
jgi:hypothetical protein